MSPTSTHHSGKKRAQRHLGAHARDASKPTGPHDVHHQFLAVPAIRAVGVHDPSRTEREAGAPARQRPVAGRAWREIWPWDVTCGM